MNTQLRCPTADGLRARLVREVQRIEMLDFGPALHFDGSSSCMARLAP